MRVGPFNTLNSNVRTLISASRAQLFAGYIRARNAVGIHTVRTRLAGEPFTLSAASPLEYTIACTGYGEADAMTEVLRMLPAGGGVLYDVGANVGLYTLLAARHGARVIAYEPAPANLKSLRENLRLNDAKGVTVRPMAVGKDRGHARFFTSGETGGSQINSLSGDVVKQFGSDRLEMRTDITTLDHEVDTLPPPDVIKIDVEGAEGLVLRGAKRLLAQYKPRLSIEVHPGAIEMFGDTTETILSLLDGAGYTVHMEKKQTRIQVSAR